MISRITRAVVSWADRHWLEFFSFAAVGLVMFIVLWPLIVYNIAAGHVGVMWYRFLGGTVTSPGSTLTEGIHFILPWDKIFTYDARLQRIDEEVTGLSVDGLTITVNLASRFVIESKYAGFLHKGIGPNYAETLMRPQLRTLVLTYISENEAAHLYSTRRASVQSVIAAQFQTALANISSNVPFEASYIQLDDVLIEEIDLPPFVRQAIEEKEKVRHMSEAYDFRLLLEEKERRRKRIEAEGIRSFQEIVAPGITDSYLRWRGIEATLELAKSNNAKVVIIGNGADGLPIILNTDGMTNTLSTAPEEDKKAKAGDPMPQTGRGAAPADPNAARTASQESASGDIPSGSPPPAGASGDARPATPGPTGLATPPPPRAPTSFAGPPTAPSPNPLTDSVRGVLENLTRRQ
ncbi:MAG: SPFH domain-containing protein [Proteobacteria bacterium]|nr:SPFH domain-containing protein [Pseudomonadota bacterium]MDA1308904.1 SPFH domain-containing protein [Pseudomonadota bacterium]